MSTATRRPERSLRWLDRTGPAEGLLQITLKHSERRSETARYRVRPFAADWGRAFEVVKLGDDGEALEVYHVNLDGPSGTCDCKGHLRHGHCKHADLMRALSPA